MTKRTHHTPPPHTCDRHYGATNMNERSSRSHVLVRVVIKRGFVAKDTAASSGVGVVEWHSNPKVPCV